MDVVVCFAFLALIARTTLSVDEGDACDADAADKCHLRVAALIPARAGSKGIKRKNLSRIGNETLIARTLRIVRKVDEFDSVWVSTDGEEIEAAARESGGFVHRRHPATATDDAATIAAVKDFLTAHKGECDVVAVIQCTSPFIRPEFLSAAHRKMMRDNLDCVFSVTRVFSLRWTEHEDGSLTPENFNPMKRPRRQDWTGELIENGMFYFVKKELVLMNETLQNDRCGVIEIPKHFSMEIDTEKDLMMASALLPVIESVEDLG